MKRTLVTLLGRARKREGGDGYEETIYRFPDGVEDPTAFFGLALARHLAPDEVVILGTTGSLWGVLVEDIANEHGEDKGPLTDLMLAERFGSVDQAMLDRAAPLIGRAMNSVVRPILISSAKDETEQYAILDAIDDAVVHDGELHFDVTHGFRHLGMVGFLASFMLERVRSLDVQGLWYGAFDMREEGVVPVLRLDGLMRVRRWLDALNRFDATGDYGVFAPLLMEDGVPKRKADCLEDAAFYERTLNVRAAARKISTFLPVLDGTLAGASGLFQRRLKARLLWAKARPFSEQQRRLANQYLVRGDFVRAALFAREACVSRLCEEHGVDTDKYETREGVIEKYKGSRARSDSFSSLRQLRNALAHGGGRDSSHMRKALENPDELSRTLVEAMQRFFG